jgi:hypothetical protein
VVPNFQFGFWLWDMHNHTVWCRLCMGKLPTPQENYSQDEYILYTIRNTLDRLSILETLN